LLQEAALKTLNSEWKNEFCCGVALDADDWTCRPRKEMKLRSKYDDLN
jgi:hypothetical protein